MSTGALAAVTTRSASPVSVRAAWCKACGICIAFCPKDCLAADSNGKAVLIAPEKCSGCGLCEIRCPEFAVTVESRPSHARRS